MTKAQEKMMALLGLSEADFKPHKQSDNERIADLENAIIEIAEMLAEVE